MRHLLLKFFIIILVFVGTVGLYLYFNVEREEESNSIMGEAKLPVISATVYNKESNLLYGYTQEMEAMYLRDSLTLIPEDHKLNLNIYRYNSGIMSVAFEVRSMDTNRLIEDTTVETWSVDGDKINAVLTINNMIEAGEEYLLIIKLSTEDYGEINYYTRIMENENAHFKEQADFVLDFYNAVYSDEPEAIISYLEPKSTQDNSDFGNANIHSSFSHITWGGLEPETVTEPVLSCKDIIGDVGFYELKYMIKAKNDYDEFQYYNVVENYRVRWTSNDMYLLDFGRTTNQEFGANNQNISGSRINLGINSEEEPEILSAESRTYISFVKERTLWLMDTKENDITKVFSFKDENDDDLRDINDSHDLEIVSIDDSGNLKFIVYGYMNRGKHEGSVGVALYSYSTEENVCRELLFIPFTRSYQILKESIGKLSYVRDDVMYIMINDCVYSIDLNGNEYVQIVSGLNDENYCINEAGDILAWQTDGGSEGANRIRVLSLRDGNEYDIRMDAKKRVRALGFINDDFIYGIANESDIYVDNNGYIFFPMNKLRVLDDKGQLLKEHSKKGTFFTDAEISENMINLKQVVRGEDGGYVSANDYQIFGNIEDNEDEISLATIVTERKKTEYVINFVYKVTTSNKLKVKYTEEVLFDETNAMSIRELASAGEVYYVYSYGKVTGIYTEEAEAIKAAYNQSGLVMDDEGGYLWKRISRPTEHMISGVSVAPTDNPERHIAACVKGMLAYNGVNKNVNKLMGKGKSSVEIIDESLDNRGLDLSGCTLEQVLYYVCNGQPVLGMINETECVLIVGYDFYNAVMINPLTGETYKYGIEETAEMFEEAGNRFIGIEIS
ncbi:MAG: hypothetical protein E7270_03325 [Lachnospiraceae bacterium]|nr:hypothetical protein [Lachnospiraceae bacterium]MBQ4069353.1 hypothetical protein [Lachnospiraceae bacterium]